MTTTTATTTAPVPLDAQQRCAHCIPVDSDLTGLFGHDPLGHRTVSTLLRYGLDTVGQLARLTALDLLLLRGLGHGAIERIRTQVPEPVSTAPCPAQPAAAAALVLFDDQAAADMDEATDTERLGLALLARLPSEVDVAPATLATSHTAAALWALTAISRSDPRIWRHVYPTGIAFGPILEEAGWSGIERMMLRLARNLAGRQGNTANHLDLVKLAGALNEDQWRALLTALQVCRAGLRGEA